MILELPLPVIEKIIWFLPTDDLVNLSRCNSILKCYCNRQLYHNVIITENHLLAPVEPMQKDYPFTILKKSKLHQFIQTLDTNKQLISLIHYITILTSSSLTNSYTVNDYEQLYQMLLSSPSKLRFLENLDYNNIKKCESFLHFNKNYISRQNYRKDLLYENDELTVNSSNLQLSKVLSLENYQIGSLTDFKLISNDDNSRLNKLSVMIEQVYNERIDIDDFKLNASFLAKLENLKVLELDSSISTEIFLTKFSNVHSCPKFPNLETLSFTYVHSIRSQFEFILNYLFFKKIFNLDSLKNLELKLNCETIDCHNCFETFVCGLIPYLTNLTSLSIVYITNENLLANSRIDFEQNNEIDNESHRSIWSKTISQLTQLKKLNYLYLNLNDFTFIPFLKLTNVTAMNLINIFNFNINQSYLYKKSTCFQTICQLKLKDLVLPDYFYNWKLFQVKQDEIEYDLQFLSYLNDCNCNECNEARMLFKLYSDSFEFVDNNRLLSSILKTRPKYFKFPIKSKSVSMIDVKNYRFFYNSFIRNLKQRLPFTDKIFKNLSGLSIIDKPFNDFSLLGPATEDHNIKRDHYNSFIKLMVHNLADDLKHFVQCNPNLQRLVLGGIFFRIVETAPKEYLFKGVYDDFTVNVHIQ